MKSIKRIKYVRIAFVLVTLSLVFSACTGSQATATLASTVPPTPATIPLPTTISSTPTTILLPTTIPLPAFTLNPGDFYFSLDGKPSMIFLRNTTGITKEDFTNMLNWAKEGGTRLIRIHLTSGFWGDPWINKDWTVNENWAQDMEWLFDEAQADGIYVMPVFGVWYDWNKNNIPNLSGGLWRYNPLNQDNGGPITEPGELFQKDSTAQKMWLAWVKTLVERWQSRRNIVAWEIFSEINFGSGAPGETDSKGAVTDTAAIYLVNQVTDILHTADTLHRPLTLSLAGIPWTGKWVDFYRFNSINFIQTHPYDDKLDKGLLTSVRNLLTEYGKPVMIGESGLWTMDTKPNAFIGIQHAIWAGVVSGAMNGRALWSQDGVALLAEPDRALAMQYMQNYATAELPVAKFVSKIDFSDFKPVTTTSTNGVWGAAVGNENTIIGWYRDAQCEPQYWNLRPTITKQAVTLTVAGSATDWKVDFYDTKDGTTILGSVNANRKGTAITIPLPDFKDDIAFKMTALDGGTAPAATTTVVPAATTSDPIAGKWSGTLTNTAGTFSMPLELTIQADCAPGSICGSFNAPQVGCAGDLFLKSINAKTFLFQEQNVTGGSVCKAGGYEKLQLNSDGSLTYQYQASPGSPVISSGTLKHP